MQKLSKTEVYTPVDWTKTAQQKAKLFPTTTDLDSHQIIFVAWLEQSKNEIPILLDLHFVKSATESNVGIYRLSIKYPSMWIDKKMEDYYYYSGLPIYENDVLNHAPSYFVPMAFKGRFEKKYELYEPKIIINCYAVGTFRIIKDSLYLERSLPMHYRDSLCKDIPDLDKCICNPKNYCKKISPNDPVFLTNSPILSRSASLDVPFGLEIEADTFLIKSTTRYNIENYYQIKTKQKLKTELSSQPIITLKSCSKTLQINKWASIAEINTNYPNKIEQDKYRYLPNLPQELSLNNARMLLESHHTKPKPYALYEDLSGTSSLEFCDCSIVSKSDSIYKMLLNYTYRQK